MKFIEYVVSFLRLAKAGFLYGVSENRRTWGNAIKRVLLENQTRQRK